MIFTWLPFVIIWGKKGTHLVIKNDFIERGTEYLLSISQIGFFFMGKEAIISYFESLLWRRMIISFLSGKCNT